MSEGLSESAIVRAIAEKTARHVIRKGIAALQHMTNMLSGDDSGLETTWDEICVQVQYEKSFSWNSYDDTVRTIVGTQIATLPKHEPEAIWSQTVGGTDWDCPELDDRETHPVCDEDNVEWLTHEHVY